MTSPNKKPSPAAEQILTGLKTELERYSKTVDLDGVLKRLQADIDRLSDEYKGREKQLHTLIDEIKAKQNELRAMDTSVRVEIERQHELRRKELDRQYDSNVSALGSLKGDIDELNRQCTDIQDKVAEQHKMNAELIRNNKEQTGIYDELAGKVNDARDLYDKYTGLIEQQKKLNSDVEEEGIRLKAKQTETKQRLDNDLTKMRQNMATEKDQLDNELRERREKLEAVKDEIRDAKEADKERQADLKSAEISLSIKRKALQREQEEFATEKRRFNAGMRI